MTKNIFLFHYWSNIVYNLLFSSEWTFLISIFELIEHKLEKLKYFRYVSLWWSVVMLIMFKFCSVQLTVIGNYWVIMTLSAV